MLNDLEGVMPEPTRRRQDLERTRHGKVETHLPLLAHEPQCCSCTSLDELGPDLDDVTDVLACRLPVF